VGSPRDPASAVVAPAWRIGWTFLNYSTIREPSGFVLDLRLEAPVTIARSARKAHEHWVCSRSSLATRFDALLDFVPLRDHLRSSKVGREEALSLAVLVKGA